MFKKYICIYLINIKYNQYVINRSNNNFDVNKCYYCIFNQYMHNNY